jgi:hypothetical protein
VLGRFAVEWGVILPLRMHNDGIIQNMSSETGDVCIPNISVKERRKRLLSGLVILVPGLVILIILLATGISPWWRLGLLPFFAGAASGFFQWRDKT